ncbi:Bacteriophage protein [Mycobacteroides abscessus subsp. abscessus]|uniref:hypothetical protein n=1 Tax=Mycobacteroides abscessus TaxID=36809 RepID=UPI00092916F4|nr:hypothetical protein [Mycobacteroides abscessus]SIC55099.1 Bacteriophage protein [Mycobacteroides abscessus subsp. abscessus]SKU58482.1 Bacteriophage protein [Mycobacteroides abscessus subsp. abscessus]
MHAALITFTVVTICWSLWIRRVTWTRRMEVAATLNIALQGAAVLMMSPLASRTVGVALHALTGCWNLEDLFAHDLYIVAASAIVYHMLLRLDQRQLMRRFKLHVELPATISLPIMMALFTSGHGVQVYRADFFRAPTDWSLSVYWWVTCGTLIYLLGYSICALVPMWREPSVRGLALGYMVSAGAGVVACVVRMVTAVLPGEIQDTAAASLIVWVLACSCGAGFAAIAAHSWLTKQGATEHPSTGGTRPDGQEFSGAAS